MKNIHKQVFIVFIVLYWVITGNPVFGSCLKHENVKDKTSKKTKEVTNRQLKAMNNVVTSQFSDTCSINEGKQLRILILGNSLTRHGIAANIGWNHVSGMAATSESKDFAHLLFKMVANRLPDQKVCLRLSNLADFERNFSSYKFSTLDNPVNYKPDILIFQLGENVSIDEKNPARLFEEKYVELVNYFKKGGKPLIICTTPFFPSAEKNEIVKNVVLKTSSYLVDLSHLSLLDSQNYAKNEKDYQGDKSAWKVDGIGIHPGDLGMENIAELLFITINADLQRTR